MATKKKPVSKPKAFGKLSGASLNDIRAYAKKKCDEIETKIQALNNEIDALEAEREPWDGIATVEDDYP